MQWVSYWTFTTFFSYNAKKYSDDEIGILKKSYGNLIIIAIYRYTNDVQNSLTLQMEMDLFLKIIS